MHLQHIHRLPSLKPSRTSPPDTKYKFKTAKPRMPSLQCLQSTANPQELKFPSIDPRRQHRPDSQRRERLRNWSSRPAYHSHGRHGRATATTTASRPRRTLCIPGVLRGAAAPSHAVCWSSPSYATALSPTVCWASALTAKTARERATEGILDVRPGE